MHLRGQDIRTFKNLKLFTAKYYVRNEILTKQKMCKNKVYMNKTCEKLKRLVLVYVVMEIWLIS